MSIVRGTASCEGGRAYLEIRNDWSKRITLEGMVITPTSTSGRGQFVPLEPLSVEPRESRRLDLTDDLLRWLGVTGFNPARIRIQLTLSPEPPSQPGPSEYLVEQALNAVTRFTGTAQVITD